MSDIESENEQEAPVHPPVVEVDVSQLTPLSPQVISKQVCYKELSDWNCVSVSWVLDADRLCHLQATINLGYVP
jgi:hypothetical protein